MSTYDPRANERLNDLLADRALDGLDPQEEAELAALLAQRPDRDPDVFDRAAAAVMLASFPGGARGIEPMPSHLMERVLAGANVGPQARRSAPPAIKPAKKADAVRWIGWLAAAACLALAAFVWLKRPKALVAISAPSSSEQLAQMLADKTALHASWEATKDPAAAGASGEVVWSPSAQKGFMRFRGLAANDKATAQYQLWIFDEARDERYPVDGGVFDVDARTGDVIVPIYAKIAVGKPTLFAVTVEKPGGVVVSKRERIVVTAKPS